MKAGTELSSIEPLSPRKRREIVSSQQSNLYGGKQGVAQPLPRDETLNPARREAAATLNEIYELLGRGRLPQGLINQAKAAVEAWINALTQARR